MQLHDQPISASALETALSARSEKYWQDVLDSLFTFVGAIATNGTLLEVNRAAVEIVALKHEDVVGQPFAETYWWSYSPSIQAQIQAAIEQARAGEIRFDIQARTKSDRPITLDFSLQPIFDVQGQLGYLIATGIDITERKQAEKVKQRHLAAMEAAIDGMAILNRDSEYIYLNQAHAQLFGYDSALDLLGKTWRELYYPDEISRFERDIFPILQQEGRWRGEATAKRRDGSTFAEEVSLTFTGDGSLICVCRDITERKRAEQRLVAQHTVTRILAESDTLSAATPRILQSICESIGWDLGEFWLLDRPANVLRCVETWHLPEIEALQFEEVTQQIAFAPGVGLPGRVFSSGEPGWITDVIEDANFYRAAIAAVVGLHGAFGFPIINGDERLGIVTFFSRESQQPDVDLLQMMAAIGSQLGQFMKRKQAEEELQRATRLQQAIFDSANYTIISTTVDGTIETFNAAAARWLGYTSQEVVGKTTPAIIHDKDEIGQRATELSQELGVTIEPGFEVFVAKARLGEPDEREWTYIRQDGSRFPVLLSVTALRDAQDKITGFLGIGSDITERKQALEALRESEERFHEAFENAAIGMALVSPNGNWLQVNRSMCEMLGYSEQELLNTTFQAITHPDDLQTDLGYMYQMLAGEIRTYQMEKRYFHKLGHVVWILLSVSLVRNAYGQPLYFVSQIQDITERKQAETALRESEERFRSLCASSPIGIFQTDVKGRCLYTNRRWQEITGLTLEASLGDGWTKAIHPEDRQAVFAEWEMCVRQGREFSMEFRFLTPQGEVRWVHSRSVAILSETGELVGYVGTNEDITSRKQVEEELRKSLETEKQLNELKSCFITMTSHEFRTPLTTILGSTELLKHYSHRWTGEKKLLYFNRIQASVQHMLRMLDDVLLLGKAEAGKLEFQPCTLDLPQLCRNLVEEWQHSLGHEHTLVFTERGRCTDVYMDEKLLMHILGNLLSNAIKYSPSGSKVWLELAYEDEKVVFQIRDQGIGIPKADQQHLFEAFYRATNVDQIPGTGLGLAIVKKAVDLHRGKITVDSQVGVGTTFTVTIPLSRK